jgi:peptide/nickel transport system permease protein
MGRYILRRLAISIPILIVITIIAFLLLQLAPGDPLNSYIPPDAPLPPEQREALRRELGLDRPLAVRYFYWLKEAMQGNLGVRSVNFEPVSSAIGHRIGPTLLLMTTSLTIGIVLGLVLGVISALKKYSILDMALTIFAFLGVSFPVYLAGLLALYVFALKLGWLPAGGMSTPGAAGGGVLDVLQHLILPAAVIALNYVASTMRYTRSAMLEVLDQDYIRTARAKGLRPRVVVTGHALKNALMPVITIIGSYIPGLLGGAVFIESIFGWPGMGRLFVDGVEARDYPLVMGLILILAIMILLVNLATDVAYALVDPRVRYD